MAYTSEEEQEINQLKDWWKENAKTVIFSVILAFAGVFGWNYWQSYQLEQTLQRSNTYEQLIASPANSQAKQVEKFVSENDKTSYAIFALLNSANIAVQAQDFTQAEKYLQQAVAQANDDSLLSISALRLAKVQFQLQQLDAALNTLAQVKDVAFASEKDLLAGDIAIAKGDNATAKNYYESALKQTSENERQWIKIRLNNL